MARDEWYLRSSILPAGLYLSKLQRMRIHRPVAEPRQQRAELGPRLPAHTLAAAAKRHGAGHTVGC
jgi:hypothetical protein